MGECVLPFAECRLLAACWSVTVRQADGFIPSITFRFRSAMVLLVRPGL